MTPQSRWPVWHPFTQHALISGMSEVAGADGVWLQTADGARIIDAISSWWVITHGHRHPRIVAAIKEQADAFDQVIFANFTHAPAEALARGLIEIAPVGLNHVFYSDSGSTAVEVAIKMALGAAHHTGRGRTRILAFEHAYHGDTVGTMSAGHRGVFNAAYEPLLYDVGRIAFPHAGFEQRTLDEAERLCRAGDVAALIVEPLLLGAGGMLIYSPHVLTELRRITKQFGVYLIADEVLTGFGRTGTLFACEQAQITPDIMCVAKGLTGGSLPLAATLCISEIFDAHFAPDRARMLFHSSSYTANPLACAAGVANLGIWKDEPVLDHVANVAAMQAKAIEPYKTDTRFSAVRQIGTITALDAVAKDAGYLSVLALRFTALALQRGVLLRPLGNTIYVMPPYCITEHELAAVYEAINSVMDLVA